MVHLQCTLVWYLCLAVCWLWQVVLGKITTVVLSWPIPMSLSSKLDGLLCPQYYCQWYMHVAVVKTVFWLSCVFCAISNIWANCLVHSPCHKWCLWVSLEWVQCRGCLQTKNNPAFLYMHCATTIIFYLNRTYTRSKTVNWMSINMCSSENNDKCICYSSTCRLLVMETWHIMSAPRAVAGMIYNNWKTTSVQVRFRTGMLIS